MLSNPLLLRPKEINAEIVGCKIHAPDKPTLTEAIQIGIPEVDLVGLAGPVNPIIHSAHPPMHLDPM